MLIGVRALYVAVVPLSEQSWEVILVGISLLLTLSYF